MSASPSDSTGTSDSESSRAPSPPQFQGPPAASTRSKKSMAQATASSDPVPLTPQPPSASTRAKKQSVQSTKSSPGIKPWNIQSTKSVTRRDHNKVTSPAVGSGQTSGSTTLPSDVEVEIVAPVNQTPKPADASNAESSHYPTLEPARLISSKTFDNAVRQAVNCRMPMKIKFQIFLRELDKNASHYGHLKVPPTLETSLRELLQAVTYQHSARFLTMAEARRFWETVRDLQDTEWKVYQTLEDVTNLLTAKSDFDKSEAEMILGQLTTINTAIEAFCTRMSAHLTLTAEQSSIFGEGDLTDRQLLYFRLASTNDLPSVEERFRLLWAVYPVHGMRLRFHGWNRALSGNNAALKTTLNTLSATIAAAGNVEEVQTEARGLKRKAEDENEDENEQ
ncbi:unnamed protein product [Aureobasidium mustum]|uniref:Uncharacterized protein n=1 Tax=Aureobasidium mustum TaxID=2773714 RepID=A0A9N8JW67_9PEZI|nr:unnamed protein product [Aureobasidium mustum]